MIPEGVLMLLVVFNVVIVSGVVFGAISAAIGAAKNLSFRKSFPWGLLSGIAGFFVASFTSVPLSLFLWWPLVGMIGPIVVLLMKPGPPKKPSLPISFLPEDRR